MHLFVQHLTERINVARRQRGIGRSYALEHVVVHGVSLAPRRGSRPRIDGSLARRATDERARVTDHRAEALAVRRATIST
jgi:hypothetical protein